MERITRALTAPPYVEPTEHRNRVPEAMQQTAIIKGWWALYRDTAKTAADVLTDLAALTATDRGRGLGLQIERLVGSLKDGVTDAQSAALGNWLRRVAGSDSYIAPRHLCFERTGAASHAARWCLTDTDA